MDNQTLNINGDNTLRINPLVKELRPVQETPNVYKTLAKANKPQPKVKKRKKRPKPAQQNKKGSRRK